MFENTTNVAINDTSVLFGADSLVSASDSITAVWSESGWEAVLLGDGLTIAFVGILIVFLSLTSISLLIRGLKRYSVPKRTKADSASASSVAQPRNGVSGELVAAISLALQSHLFELHDEERTILTISKVSKPYSPWSSKIHVMTPNPSQSIKR